MAMPLQRCSDSATTFRLTALCAMLWAAGWLSLPAQAGPEGGAVRIGDARIEAGGAVTRIQQTSDRAVIDWRTFDIRANEAVLFQQPSAGSATLNRVGGGQGSHIDGRLEANGQIFIVNPHGVIFGQGAQINVGSLLTTTADIADGDFMAGRLRFDQPGRPGSEVRNEGRITAADGGLVALVAPSVRNDGIIAARLGRVALASGEAFTLDLYGDDLIRFTVAPDQTGGLVDAQGRAIAGRLDQTGVVAAPGGTVVFLTAGTGKATLDRVVNLSGLVQADTVDDQQGRILLVGAGATARVDGTLQARGDDAGESGGLIHLVADRLTLEGASLDASGAAGGGTIHLGGDWQGQGPGPRATHVTVDAASRLAADARAAGRGGEVVVWSDGDTAFAGRISARGGPAGGAGGRVEVSGKASLAFTGTVDAGADAGQAGMLLLDPATLTINDLEASILGRVLRTGTSTTLQADQDITVNAAVDGRGLYSGGGLTLDAGRDIQLNDHIVTQDGPVNLTAQSGTIHLAPGAAVFAGSAPITLVTGETLAAGSLITSGLLSLTSLGGSVFLQAPVEPGNGELRVRARDDIEVNAPVVNLRAGSDLHLDAGRDLRLNAQMDGIGGTPGGRVTLSAGGDLAVNRYVVTNGGPITVTAGGSTVISPDGGLVATNGAVQVASHGDIGIAGLLDAGGGARLESSAGSVILNAPIAASTGDLVIRAGQDVQVNQPLVNLQSGGDLDVAAGRDLTVNARIDGSIGTPGGSVSLDAGRNLTIGEAISTGSGAIALRSGAATRIAGSAGLYAGTAPIAVTAGTTLETGPIVTSGPITLAAASGPLSLGPIVGGAGAISLTSPSDLRIGQPIVFGNGGSLSLSAPGSIAIDAYVGSDGDGSVSVSAGGSATVSQPIVAGAGAIDIDAGGNIGFTGAGGAYGGSIGLAAGTSLTTGPLVSSGPVSLRAGGSMIIGAPLLFGSGGALSATAGSQMNVIGPIHGRGGAGAALTAGGSIVLSRDVAVDGGTLSLSGGTIDFAGGGLYGGSGSVALASAGSLVTGPLQGATGVSVSSGGSITIGTPIGAGTGAVGLTAADFISIAAPIAGVGSLSASAGSNIGVDARIETLGGVSLGAGGDVLINEDVIATSGAATVSAGGTVVLAANGTDSYGAPLTRQLRAGGGISVTAGGDLQTGSLVTPGPLVVQSLSGDVTIAVPIYETTGNTLIRAGGDIHIDQVIANTTTGADLSLVAGGRIDVDAKVGPWDRSDATYPVIDRNALPGGRISMVAGGDLNLNQPVATYRGGLADPTAAALSLTSTGGSVNIAPNLRVSSDGGAISVSSYADLSNGPVAADVNATASTGYFTTGALSLTSTHGNVTINQTIPNTTGAVTISAGNGVQVNQRIYSNNADIRITAGPGGIIQNPTVDPNPDAIMSTGVLSDIDPGRGNLTLQAVGDILPTIVRTGSVLTMVSTGGQISGGKVQPSRDTLVTPTGQRSPSAIVMAGHTGIANFDAGNTPSLRAISDGGSIVNLISFNPGEMLFVAAQDIFGLPGFLGLKPSLYAGRDITFQGGMVATPAGVGNPLTAYAGRDLTITGELLVPSASLSAGLDPFATLGGLTIGGVAVPAWSGPPAAGSGNALIAVTDHLGNPTPTAVVWTYGRAGLGLDVRAAGNIALPRVHVGATGDGTDGSPYDAQQPLTLAAGRNVDLGQIETTGTVSISSTGGDITLGSTIGPHVGPAPGTWNPTDQGVASLSLIASTGNINMHEARAVGDITIAAPLGQVTFAGGPNGIESTSGTRSVTDSDGVLYSDTIDITPVPRLPVPGSVAPAIAVGPTLAGPGAPPIPGALPPGAPASLGISSGSPTLASASAPAGGGTDGGTPGAVGVGGGQPQSAGISGTASPDGSDGFGEIFVAETAAESGKTKEDEPSRKPDQEGDDGAAIDDPEQEARRKARAKTLAGLPPGTPVLIFEGGRGVAREKDFGHDEPVEYSRVRP